MRLRLRHALFAAALSTVILVPAALAAESESPAPEVDQTTAAEQQRAATAELRQWLRKQQRISALGAGPPRPTTPPDGQDGTDTPTKPPRKPPARPPKLRCTQPAVGRFVRRYTTAFNRGKAKHLRRFFTAKSVPVSRGEEGGLVVLNGDQRGFRWYTVSKTRRGLSKSARRFFLGRKRGQVVRYAINRRKRGERLRFVAVTGFEYLEIGGAPHAGIAFRVRQRAKDLLPRKRWRTVKGRALIDCQSAKISAFSLER